MSSKNAKILSEANNLSDTEVRLLCRPRLKSNGIRGSPCSPPSPWRMSWVIPQSSSHKCEDGWPQNWRTNGHNLSPCSMAINPETMALREMRSKAPTPSIEHHGCVLVQTRQCLQRVGHGLSSWNGVVASRTALENCWANVRATNRRRKSPTIPRTPPSGFLRTLWTFRCRFSESRITRRCSPVMPEGPPAAPQREERRFS